MVWNNLLKAQLNKIYHTSDMDRKSYFIVEGDYLNQAGFASSKFILAFPKHFLHLPWNSL